MVQSKATTVEEYIAALPPDRRRMVSAIRKEVLNRLPSGYVEGMQYGMVSYLVPLETYPMTYNKLPLAFASLASQKNYVSLYLNNLYADHALHSWFLVEYGKTGKHLDMGKSCLRFKRFDDIPLDLLGEAVARTPVANFIKLYEASRVRARAPA